MKEVVLTPELAEAKEKFLHLLRSHMPEGFQETMQYGMDSFVVPHSLYPAGYHCDPKQALPFVSLAVRPTGISFYHMGIYADPVLLDWFQQAFAKASTKKLDMGKSCIRFKKPADVPWELMAELAGKMTVQNWIDLYEANVKK
jgi:hypothetical protein